MIGKMLATSFLGLALSVWGFAPTPCAACLFCGSHYTGYSSYYPGYYGSYYAGYYASYAPRSCCYSCCPTSCCPTGCATGCCPTGCSSGCSSGGCASGGCAVGSSSRTYYAQRSDRTRPAPVMTQSAPHNAHPVRPAATPPERSHNRKSLPLPPPVTKEVPAHVAAHVALTPDMLPIPPRVVQRAPIRLTIGPVRTASARNASRLNGEWTVTP